MAQAQYDAAVTAARAQQGAARLTDRLAALPVNLTSPYGTSARTSRLQQPRLKLILLNKLCNRPQTNLDQVVKNLNNSDFVNAEARLAECPRRLSGCQICP